MTAPAPRSAPVADLDGSRRRPLAPTIATASVLFPLLAAAAILPLLPWYRDMDSTQVVLSLFQVLVCLAGATCATAGGLRPCLLVASVFPFCWLAVPAVYQISHTQAAWGDAGVTLQAGATVRAQAILVVAQVVLVGAYLMADALKRSPRNRDRRDRLHPRGVGERGRRSAAVVSLGLLLGTGALLPLVVGAAGGLGAFFSSRQGFSEALRDNGYTDNASPLAALATLVPGALATVATVLGVYLFRTRMRQVPGQGRVALGLCLVGLLFLCIVANPFAFSRFIFLTCFGPVLLVSLRPSTRLAALAWLVGTVTAFLLAYPAADLLRLEDNQAPADVTAEILASKDYDGFQQTINTVTYVDAEGTARGIHLVSGLLFFVPRDFWAEKALPASLEIAEARGYTFTNLSLPIPAEGYLDAGWWGIVVVMTVLGSIFAVLDRAWRSGTPWALVAAYLAMAQVGLWRGPFGSQMPVFAFAAAVLVASVWIMTRGSDERGRGPVADVPGSAQGRHARPGPVRPWPTSARGDRSGPPRHSASGQAP